MQIEYERPAEDQDDGLGRTPALTVAYRSAQPTESNLTNQPHVYLDHHYPRFMTKLNWWQSSWDLCVLSALLVLIAWLCGALTWQVWLFAILAANANQLHKWTHRTRTENGPVISFLQDIRVLQTARHHARHHTDPKNSHYCTMTNVLNPVLDGVRFWDGMEWALARTTGLQRRPDTSVRGHGPGPQWLVEYRR